LWNAPLQFYNILCSTFQGYHGDTSATFLCGDVDDKAKKLVKVISMVSGDQF
jgi:methionine aminopeptidase